MFESEHRQATAYPSPHASARLGARGEPEPMLAPLAEGSRFGLAWVTLCAALAIHVADEAVTGFLSVYNPPARAIRARVPFPPLPTFPFPICLTPPLLPVTTPPPLPP